MENEFIEPEPVLIVNPQESIHSAGGNGIVCEDGRLMRVWERSKLKLWRYQREKVFSW